MEFSNGHRLLENCSCPCLWQCRDLKPANETPASAHALADIIHRAGLPKGAFQLVMGSGHLIGQALAEHPHVDAVTFTGSYETGRQVAMACAPNLTKYQLELGSKNALVVMDDADLESAVAAAAAGIFRHRPKVHSVITPLSP